jgi:hypothetical protein
MATDVVEASQYVVFSQDQEEREIRNLEAQVISISSKVG